MILSPVKHLNDTALKQIQKTPSPLTTKTTPKPIIENTASPSGTLNPTSLENLREAVQVSSESGIVILPKDLKNKPGVKTPGS